MDVMLPEPDAADSSETRWALETARNLWGQGERREALQWVRRAAEAAAESGQDDRALLLAKQGAELRNSLDIPRTVPPPAPAGPAAPAGAGSSPSLAGLVPPGIPRPGAVPGVEPSAPPPAAAPTAKSVVPAIPIAPVAAPSVVPVTAAAPSVVPVTATAPSAAPVTAAVPSVVPVTAAAPSVAPGRPISQIPPPSERGDEVVVTVVQTDGSVPAPDAALVSRRAVRVAVIAVDAPNELRVKKLAPGEVAPKDSTVALLVAFEPGAPPVPEQGS